MTATISSLSASQVHAADEPPDPLLTCTPIELAAAYIGASADDLAAAVAVPRPAMGGLGINVVVDQLDAAEAAKLTAAAAEPDDAQRALATWSAIALHDTLRQRLLAYALGGYMAGMGVT